MLARMKLCTLLLMMIVLPAALLAQIETPVSVTVAIFASTATDPNVNAPIRPPVSYALSGITCGASKVMPPPIVNNPTEARYDDPANTVNDCFFNVAAQIVALPIGVNYKAAFRQNGATTAGLYGGFSNAFNRVQTAPAPLSGPRVR